MAFIKISEQGNVYPYTIARLREENPTTSFPENYKDIPLASFSVFPVAPMVRPVCNEAEEKVVELAPMLVGAEWVQDFAVVPLDPQEKEAYKANLISEFTQAVQDRLDEFAKTRNYDGSLSACTYATSTVPKFKQEGQYCVDMRDQTWLAMYQLMEQVQLGNSPVPSSFTDIEPLLPALVWPT